jgi:hypothetical protein
MLELKLVAPEQSALVETGKTETCLFICRQFFNRSALIVPKRHMRGCMGAGYVHSVSPSVRYLFSMQVTIFLTPFENALCSLLSGVCHCHPNSAALDFPLI